MDTSNILTNSERQFNRSKGSANIKRKYPIFIIGFVLFVFICSWGCVLQSRINDYYFDYSPSQNIAEADIEATIIKMLTPITDDYEMITKWNKDNKYVYMTFPRGITISFEPLINRIELSIVDKRDSINSDLVNRISTGLSNISFNYTMTHEESRGSFLLP